MDLVNILLGVLLYCILYCCKRLGDSGWQPSKFHEHILQLPRMLTDSSIIHKIFHYFDKVNLYLSTYTKLIFDLWNIIWGPLFVLDQQQVEKVQKRATRLVHDLCNHAYENRLVELNLPSLKYQKHWGAMIMIYQLLHHKLNVNPSVFYN